MPLLVIFACLVAASGLMTGCASNNPAAPEPNSTATEQVVVPSITRTALDLPETNTPGSNASSLTTASREASTVDGTQTREAKPSATVSPSPTPTSVPQMVPSLAVTVPVGILNGYPPPTGTVAIPTPVPTFEVPENTTNVLLLGSDVGLSQGVGRTDTMIIVAINRDGPTASMVSLPRDLYVYIPGWAMNRLNTALSRGASSDYPSGAVGQLEDTILYNFGVPIHYYARVDFNGFKQAVDLMGGVDVAVSCQLKDWRLISPELDPQLEESWEMFTLERGVYHMDGDMALWYARSRRTTSDFDRGRRQQQILRAMLNQGVDLNLLAQVPDLWTTYKDSVETDIDVGRLLQFVTLAPAIRENGVQNLYIVGDQLQPYSVPGSGAAVQLPIWEDKMEDTFRRLFLPPALNQATRPPIRVEVINGTDNPDLPLLAADNLEWYGFEPVLNNTPVEPKSTTTLEYFAQNFKGSFDWLISWIFKMNSASISLVPDTPYDYDYRVVLGADYNPCRPHLFAPQIFLGE